MAGKCTIREVTKDIWTFSCPFARLNLLPVGGRSTAVKLRNGDVWVLASTPLDAETQSKLNEIGPVKWIIGADREHHLYLSCTDVWIFSSPFARFGFLPFGGRSTAVKLPSGDVWVLASTPLNSSTKVQLDEIGPVKWIVSPDKVHHLYLAEFKKAYPDAKLVAVDEVKKQKEKQGLEFHGAWGEDAPDQKYGFEDDIKHCFFSGYINKDVAFFHPASKTLIQADLLFNLPATEQYSKGGWLGKLPLFGSMKPDSWLHRRFVWMAGQDKEAMKRDVKTVADWDFDRIIPCHGDVIEVNGKEAWKAAYQDYFE